MAQPISAIAARIAEGGRQLAGADRNTVVTLAAALVGARADAEGSSYFQDLAEQPLRRYGAGPGRLLPGPRRLDVAAAIARLDKAATMDLGLPQYFRGLALAELLRAGPSEVRPVPRIRGGQSR